MIFLDIIGWRRWDMVGYGNDEMKFKMEDEESSKLKVFGVTAEFIQRKLCSTVFVILFPRSITMSGSK